MSISSDIYITRKEALQRVYSSLLYQQQDLLMKAVNSMSNGELSSYLHCDFYYYNVDGKGKLTDGDIVTKLKTL